ncbi:LIM-domain-containing protein [Mycena indigotica]|uniref:LIM-domain-containing protein n=1 Tax=Mycena indigotica TaxID=2126181 RepID=A0A8H6T2I1_9AGAR|nr:LIM-domain-containing protein [Mycena indigotica]KAF7309709.1 LIM-domain-containing protein [Mycena indigotica]
MDNLQLDSIFPEEDRPPSPEATIAIYNRDDDILDVDWRQLKIRLVGSHPLWGHHLWNAGRVVASYLDHHRNLYLDENVLELGAGGGLPGLVAAKSGAKHVVLSDYPDESLIQNLEHNIRENEADRGCAVGFIWGRKADLLMARAPGGFQVVILSDLVFNHSQHDALLDTCEVCLAKNPEARVLVFYTHHRPHLAHRDLDFFVKARDRGWQTEEVVNVRRGVMFEEDRGDVEVRATVHGVALSRPQ